MNLQEQISRMLREENFIPLEDLTTVIKDYEGGFDVFIMNKDEKVGEISFAKESLPNLYTIVDASIDDEYKGNRIYPKTIINLFKERPNIIINSVFRSPEAEKSWRHLLNNLPPNIGKSVKYYKDEDTTLFQLKLKNLQEQISRMKSMMGLSEQFDENLPSEEKDSDFSNSEVKDVVWRAGELNLNPKSGGLWFGETKDGVEKFALSVRGEKREGKPYLINLQNPFYFDSFWHGYINSIGYEPNGREMLMKKLQSQGYDGIIIDTDTWNDTGDDYSVTSKQYVVFDTNNVKPV